VLARTPGKHKQRRHNSQGRKLEAAGGYQLVSARTPEAVDTLLSAFFTMKAERFRRMGIRNVFAGREVQAFFRRLYREALDAPSPRFVLHGLEVGGELRAVTGCSVLGDRMTCDFSSISENGIASASPGDFLFFEDIKEACQNGLRVFDFSVGEQPYKRLWCDIETHQQDAFLPLSGKGRAMMLARRRLGAAKRALKKRPAVWAIVKRLQRVVVRGSRTASETRDD
jgi:CelD/BcsL family acetyltransferase involved in cellulose biosynthesis